MTIEHPDARAESFTSAPDRVLFRNTMRITPGHLVPFTAAIGDAVRFVEEHGPQLLVDVFIDEEQLEATSFQLYADSDAVLRHWELSEPYIADVMRHAEVKRFEVFGHPSEEVVAGLQASGIEVSFSARLTGYRDVRRARPSPGS